MRRICTSSRSLTTAPMAASRSPTSSRASRDSSSAPRRRTGRSRSIAPGRLPRQARRSRSTSSCRLSARTISGHLFAGDGQTPVHERRVCAADRLAGNSWIQYIYLDANGAYTFGLMYLSASGFQVTRSRLQQRHLGDGGQHRSRQSARTGDGERHAADVGRPRPRAFSDGTAVSRASVFVVDAARAVSRYTQSPPDGSYAVINVAARPRQR